MNAFQAGFNFHIQPFDTVENVFYRVIITLVVTIITTRVVHENTRSFVYVCPCVVCVRERERTAKGSGRAKKRESLCVV